MTGYGKGTASLEGRKMKIEIKSLNGKIPDVRMKMPGRYREKELDIRKLIMEGAKRGKMDVAFSMDGQSLEEEFDLDKDLFRRYLTELKGLKASESIEGGDLISAVMRFPNVIQSQDTEITSDEWESLKRCLQEALDQLHQFRLREGAAMERSIKGHIDVIETKLKEIEPFEEARVATVRQRLQRGLQEHLSGEHIDENRYEQEVLFYLEKLDITEEKVRLSQHCKYFSDVLNTQEDVKGKKLAFISQEMGREINTLGAKAQSSDIQRCVVEMKDELEKIKEMLANTV
ncbi:MAG: YicC/YloC family endoribonuclease [Saprospiraceae bacterium]|nr:YicC/YloC family endoribonuclease [Saprospiraceae bacterium]